MKRDKILVEKDRVQKKLWQEAEREAVAYASLIHKKASKIVRHISTKAAVL
jgi:hypothetical protein